MKPYLAVVVACFGALGCATLHSAYMSNVQVPKGKSGKDVSAESHKWVFLAFSFNNDYVYEVKERLKGQCENGKITGVLSTYETDWYVLVTKHMVTAKGVCLQ